MVVVYVVNGGIIVLLLLMLLLLLLLLIVVVLLLDIKGLPINELNLYHCALSSGPRFNIRHIKQIAFR